MTFYRLRRTADSHRHQCVTEQVPVSLHCTMISVDFKHCLNDT